MNPSLRMGDFLKKFSISCPILLSLLVLYINTITEVTSMKKLFAITLILAVMLTTPVFANRMDNEMNANMYNTTMLVHFMENGYPDHYGGAYLDMETGHLVIKVKGLTPELEQYYYDLTGAEFLMFENAEKSLNELWNELKESGSPGYIDESENKVVTDEKADIQLESAATKEKTHTVVRGDCLWNIAKKYLGKGSRWNEIYQLNRDIIKNPDLIYAGQIIKLP